MPNLSQYPSPPGNRNQVVATIAGPGSYSVVVTGAAPSGGIVVTAQQLGLVSIESAHGGASDNGQYEMIPIFDGNPAKDVSQVRFLVRTLNTGAEAAPSTNLAARTFRLYAFGY
jgi:hypothetical protein